MSNELLESKLTRQEIEFCQLVTFGCDPYAGNPSLCYREIFHVKDDKTCRYNAQRLAERPEISEYLNELRCEASYEAADVKNRLTAKLFKIMDETSTAVYTDRRGTVLSPAPLRSVAVQAAKTLMEIYPVRVANESKLELAGGGDTGITFNVIVPDDGTKKAEQKILDQG